MRVRAELTCVPLLCVSLCPLSLSSLTEYGIYVAAIIDGDSRKVLSLLAKQTKMAWWVYILVFLPFVAVHGFSDQLVTDAGEEWCLRC